MCSGPVLEEYLRGAIHKQKGDQPFAGLAARQTCDLAHQSFAKGRSCIGGEAQKHANKRLLSEPIQIEIPHPPQTQFLLTLQNLPLRSGHGVEMLGLQNQIPTQ